MKCVVTVDSGILHMSGVVGTPVIGIFGPTDYQMRTAYYRGSYTDSRKLIDCAPCWYNYPCLGKDFEHKPFECLNRVSVDCVVEETLRWVK